jgi:hypothetical protein
MAAIYSAVAKTGLPNHLVARIPLPTNLHIETWRSMAVGYEDQQVLDFLEFGFPASYKGPIPDSTFINHASARNNPSHIAKYVEKEVAQGAMLGPHRAPMFAPWSQVNPLLTRPKKDSTDRRVIVDLSFPHAPLNSVNGSTPTEEYLQVPFKLKLPSAQDLAQLIKEGGRGCLLYSISISHVSFILTVKFFLEKLSFHILLSPFFHSR